jgi:hypothetical protein
MMGKTQADNLSEALSRLAKAEGKLADVWAKYFSDRERMRRKMAISQINLRKLRGLERIQFDRIETLLTRLVEAFSGIFSESSEARKDKYQSFPR